MVLPSSAAGSTRRRQDQRLRLHLPPGCHQACARRTGRPLDLRRHRVQLAAAPSTEHIHAGRFAIENEPDGSRTVWLSEHEPMNRMKGMHGVCLRPGSAAIELKVRLYNRTPWRRPLSGGRTSRQPSTSTTRASSRLMSAMSPITRNAPSAPFRCARAATTGWTMANAGGRRAAESAAQFAPTGYYPPNDLSWYANIPVPTSYMCLETKGDFFGGYDHKAGAGVVHVANHHIAPGKKQWTWGNHAFGYAWDRNLTEPDERAYRPYIELMAGAYTDNQPDFSFLAPGETKEFRQYWYPIRAIGTVQQANPSPPPAPIGRRRRFESASPCRRRSPTPRSFSRRTTAV